MRKVFVAALGALMFASTSVMAVATDDLERFLNSVTSAQGTFEQTVYTREGENKDGAGSGQSGKKQGETQKTS